MLGTRPDIAYAVTCMAQCAANPSQDHMDKALWICRYLMATRDYEIVYNPKGEGLFAHVDADHAGDPVTRRSITGYFFQLAGGIVSWQSRAQKSVALSLTESEYMALTDCAKQATWFRSLLKECGYPQTTPTQIYGDNMGSLFLAGHPAQERRTKHIDIRYHYIRQQVEEKVIDVFWVQGNENPADIFTKSLGRVLFEKFRSVLGMKLYLKPRPVQ